MAPKNTLGKQKTPLLDLYWTCVGDIARAAMEWHTSLESACQPQRDFAGDREQTAVSIS